MTKKLDTMEQRVTQCCEDFVLPLSRIWYLKSWSSAFLHMLKIAADNKLWLADIIRKLKMLNFIRNWPQLAEFKKGSEGIIAAEAVGCQSRWSGFRSTLLSRVTASRAGLGREIISYNAVLLVYYASLILSEVKFRMELRFCKRLGSWIYYYTIHDSWSRAERGLQWKWMISFQFKYLMGWSWT